MLLRCQYHWNLLCLKKNYCRKIQSKVRKFGKNLHHPNTVFSSPTSSASLYFNELGLGWAKGLLSGLQAVDTQAMKT